MERNSNISDVGSEDHGVIDGPSDAQQANSDTAPAMCELTTHVRSLTFLPFDESSIGIHGGVVLDCREPVYFYELFMRAVWQLIVQERDIYGIQMDPHWKTQTLRN
ncbi:hypothetical protein KIN20_013143 [Parelaphostrongylus tenuis]|uniref:Uncharacterized protein n=1 Tax=Parelaphostrongylus tenuis TaxID=148309 RepID=A0AAD5MBQ6_PARTN|nr:hypothetical protein KIN20_013143 [Parelaphostrongylus tenuis]